VNDAADALGDGTDGPVKVLYFAGSGRSGTTVVNNLLGQVSGAFAAGEIRYLWQRGVVEDRLCACGQPFSRCQFWGPVMADAIDESSPAAADIAAGLLSRLRILRLPGLLWRRATGRPGVAPHPHDSAIERLYRAIAHHSGGAVVLDSSKLPPYGVLLSQLPGIELYLLHVVRDPRAAAFSWQRTKPLLDFGDDQVMPQQTLWKSSLLWLLWNSVTILLWGPRSNRYIRVRYEDFASAPEQTLAEVVRMIGLDPTALPFVGPHQARVQPTHSVAGNPARLSSGTVRVKPDTEWMHRMGSRDHWVVTALTAPCLLSLGYAVRGRPADGDSR
jgi:Sulfotransferase domain